MVVNWARTLPASSAYKEEEGSAWMLQSLANVNMLFSERRFDGEMQ
jgi:hypothetical protein